MKAIAAVDLNWGIGYQGQLLERIPEDMKFFQQKTIGKVVVMGRETFESLPGKQPLKDRTNVVLSTKLSNNQQNITVCRSLEELFDQLERYNSEDIFVIGGETIYKQLLPLCTEIYITKIERSYAADKYFINLDAAEDWKIEDVSEAGYYNNIRYSFLKYKRIKEKN